MKVLLTGAGGFVAPHFINALRSYFSCEVDLVVTAREPRQDASVGPMRQLDVTDQEAVRTTIATSQCTHVVHLAGLAAVTAAAANPQTAWRVHLEGTLNIANGILQERPECVLIFVGSGQVYGMSARSGAPVDERTLLDPIDNYSVTKAAADLALGAMAKQGLRCVRMRPFNHTGPGQGESFVVASFAMQIARIEAGLQPPVIRVGNLEAERDFLDVRDVASAYVLAVAKSPDIADGRILNLASGVTHRIRGILDMLLGLSSLRIKIEQDESRVRTNDLPRIVGDANAARRLLGWSPIFSLDQTLNDLLEDCRVRVGELKRQPNRVGW